MDSASVNSAHLRRIDSALQDYDVREYRVKAINANDATVALRESFTSQRFCGNDNNLLALHEDFFQIFISRKFPNVIISSVIRQFGDIVTNRVTNEPDRLIKNKQTSFGISHDIDIKRIARLSK
jgi:hypothetical protein